MVLQVHIRLDREICALPARARGKVQAQQQPGHRVRTFTRLLRD
jgi:hypothetical protein